jgi:phospholipid/cholesterol/gamma-HCH transport system substrate-binding protein
MAAARRSAAELLAGGVVILVALGFLAYAVANTGRAALGGMHLTASFDNTGGLAPGADVRIAGVKVGSVTSAGIDPKTYQAVLGLTVRPDIQLPTDSSATIASGGLLGGGFVSLSPGGADTVLKDGGAITITQSAVNLEDLLGKFIFNVGSLADASQKMLQRQGGAPGGGQSGASP